MNRTTYDILRDLAPIDPVDAAGLEVARAAVERGRRGERAVGAFPVNDPEHLVVPGGRRAGSAGRVLVALTVSVLLIGAGAVGAVLIRDVQPVDAGPPVGAPEPISGSTVVPPSASPSNGPDVRCDDLNSSVDGVPEIPASQWPGLIDHGWTLPDVPVTASPTLQGTPVECAGEIASVVFADPADDRAVVVYEQLPSAGPLASGASLGEAEVGTVGSGDHFVAWTDEHGRPRFAGAGGVSTAEFRAILESLTYHEDGSVTGPVPDGFERVATPETKPGATLYLWRMWHDESTPYLWAWWPVTKPIEAGIADGRQYTAVEFDGGVALYDDGMWSPNPPSLRWDRDGVRFWLSDSGADLETLKARARSVRPLDLGDSRLAPFLDR